MLTFQCGVCRTTLQAPPEKAGGLVRCPNCKQTLRVPTPQAAELAAMTSGSSAQSGGASTLDDQVPSLDAPSQPQQGWRTATNFTPAPVPSGRRYGFNCQYCSSRLEAQDSNAGQQGQCPTCGKDIIVPILDRYGRLIDPMTGQVIKQDPHPVHAYAAAGERAPKIIRKNDGGQAIQCPRCRSVSPINVNNCGACGMPFTMEGTTIEATGANNGHAVASLVLGIIGLPTFMCFAICPILAIVFGSIALVNANRDGTGNGRGMAIAGIILGVVGLAFGAMMLAR
jgi:DNA-directed RNA polymerase subunit RPC12/RpoP